MNQLLKYQTFDIINIVIVQVSAEVTFHKGALSVFPLGRPSWPAANDMNQLLKYQTYKIMNVIIIVISIIISSSSSSNISLSLE